MTCDVLESDPKARHSGINKNDYCSFFFFECSLDVFDVTYLSSLRNKIPKSGNSLLCSLLRLLIFGGRVLVVLVAHFAVLHFVERLHVELKENVVFFNKKKTK